jgi:protein SCO1
MNGGALGWGRLLALAAVGAAALFTLAHAPVAWSPPKHDALSMGAVRNVGVEPPPPLLWRAPELGGQDQHGRAASLDTLRGRPWVADLVFTQCTSACPLLTAKMVLLQRKLEGLDVRFVSISVDPAHDTPAVLATYAERWNPTEQRWLLLHTDAARLATILAGFRLTMETPPGEEIRHSKSLVLVDAEGWVRGHYDSNDPNAVAALESHARRLGRATARLPSEPSAGLIRSLGCAGCHADPKLAPPLENVLGRPAFLDDGTTVVADVDYIRRAIVDPGGQRVAGYPLAMPSYERALTPELLAALVREVALLHGEEARAPRPAALAVDPVCNMEVRAAADTPQLMDGARPVYFCSESCRDAYRAGRTAR